mmetsp:Transcript_47960/g.144937  ORF Transcript_47960/g.144937 Transcript_47960/m.144937 type:complete len:92 (+) Transcript_47960:40-315(+)
MLLRVNQVTKGRGFLQCVLNEIYLTHVVFSTLQSKERPFWSETRAFVQALHCTIIAKANNVPPELCCRTGSFCAVEIRSYLTRNGINSLGM